MSRFEQMKARAIAAQPAFDRLRREWSGRIKAKREMAVAAGAPSRKCEHLGAVMGEAKGCFCSNKGIMFPVYQCTKHDVQCTITPTVASGEYRICQRCPDGPWGALLQD